MTESLYVEKLPRVTFLGGLLFALHLVRNQSLQTPSIQFHKSQTEIS